MHGNYLIGSKLIWLKGMRLQEYGLVLFHPYLDHNDMRKEPN